VLLVAAVGYGLGRTRVVDVPSGLAGSIVVVTTPMSPLTITVLLAPLR